MDNKEKIIVNVDDGENDVINASNKSEHSHSSGSHHHSHHSSHHHHSSKRRSRNTKKEKAKQFFKRYKYRLANIFIALLFIVILIIVGVSLDGKSDFGSGNSGGDEGIVLETNSTLNIKIPFFAEDVVIAGTAIEIYMESEDNIDAFDVYKDYAALGRLDTGLPVKLSYEVTGIPGGYSVEGAEVFVSENENMTPSLCYQFADDETNIDIYHLKVNTQYYYKIVLSISNGSKTSVEGSFKTADTPRILSVDGVYNLRDIGNWKTVDGKTVKQGMLYRSAELDGAVESDYVITPDGVNTMLTVLGIRTDMDLRYAEDNKNGTDALGAGVRHIYYGAPMYDGAFTAEGKAAIRKVFADLADINNYPVLMHCTHGMDRTGTVCYLLEAVLGVSEEDLMREYQLSAFCHGELWGLSKMNEFVGRLKSYDGDTMQKRAENYLLSTGVTQAEIESIRQIFLGN